MPRPSVATASWGPSSAGAPRCTVQDEMKSRGEIVIGELDGDVSDRVVQLRKILSAAAPTTVTNNITGVLEQTGHQLRHHNAGGHHGETLEPCSDAELPKPRPGHRQRGAGYSSGVDVALEPVGGTLDLARSYEALELTSMQGWRLTQVRQHLRCARWAQAASIIYMLQSLERGRHLEIDYLNGYVVVRARNKGIRVPRPRPSRRWCARSPLANAGSGRPTSRSYASA